MSLDRAVESALRRDRLLVLAALGLVVVVSWAYVLAGAGMKMSAFEMAKAASGRGGMGMMAPAVWNLGYAVLMFFMWWVMMVAMMLPSATPMVLLFTAMNRKRRENGNPFVPTTVFASAYLVVWAGFSVVAVAMQWGLEATALLSPMLVSTNGMLSALLLIAAGLYQLTPIKQACLKHCRSPIHFVMTGWRDGQGGAFRMGVEHGAYCVGCCWFLMGLLFFGGVMNLYWIGGIAVIVLLEKTVPAGHWLSHAVGGALVIWGSILLLGTV
jgi:predicted metal-binding membrane protein